MLRAISWLLGLEDIAAIGGARLSLIAPWVQGKSFWLVLLSTAAIAGSIVFYARTRGPGITKAATFLAVFRGSLLVLLLLTLAEPMLELTIVRHQRPHVYLVFDGTESMEIADELAATDRRAIHQAVGWARESSAPPARIDYVRSLLQSHDAAWLADLAKKNVALDTFLFTGNTTNHLRRLELTQEREGRPDGKQLAEQLQTTGQVTALGAVFEGVTQQSTQKPSAIILFSDFAHNSGPLPRMDDSSAMLAGAPIFTVGVGATNAIDLAVDLQIDPKLKKAERSSLAVKLRQSGLNGQAATVRLSARRMSGDTATLVPVGERTVNLKAEQELFEFPFTPDEAGRFEFVASVQPLSGEVSEANNQAARQVNIVDDYLRLLYAAKEPTWEWRFVKEVFHRDKLVGMEGFRTYLHSSDPQVRENNVLFLPSLTPPRSVFFATDVLFLDDLPREMVSERFAGFVKEYVANLGGGLVIMAGPRAGLRDLYQTPLADLLPVTIDPQAPLRTAPEHPEFPPRLAPAASRYAFMQLDLDAAANRRAWETIGKLSWYQPVAMVHPQAEVLAEHPTDRCADGRTAQPLIAVRKYGKGEVVYLGFNEMWRLRRQHGEKYYRQFWSQLIYRLGMSHALGADKRFVVRVDQPQYRSGDRVLLSVEAYDENYEPLGESQGSVRSLDAELIVPSVSSAGTQAVTLPLVRRGLFEGRLPVEIAGPYRVRVKDPLTGNVVEQRFEVTNVSAEKQRVVRDDKLQESLAEATGGRSYDLTNVDRLPNELELKPSEQRLVRNVALWATPLWFGAVVSLMLGEWLVRKLMRLA